MPDRPSAPFDIGHPAPARDRVSGALLGFGFVGAPLAWSLQLATNAALAGLACLPDSPGAGVRPPWPETADWMIAANLAAAALALAALLAAWRCLSLTKGEEARRSGGVMGAGEGRSRFIAVWGVWVGILFLLVTGTNTVAVLWSGLCAT